MLYDTKTTNAYTRKRFSWYLAQPLRLRLYVFNMEKLYSMNQHKRPLKNIKVCVRVFYYEITNKGA